MNKRNFPDFLSAYYQYACDGFCPDKFHFWAGISIIAGALERKVYIKKGKYSFYPNLYVMLVSPPGIGKSSAIGIGVDGILSNVENLNLIPQHITEAKFVEEATRAKSFYIGNKEHLHSSSYWCASEGSNVLKENPGGGNIIPLITELYDCPDSFKKATVGSINASGKNLCLNILGGLTFDFAKELILGQNSAGGFASRNIYVIHDSVMVRNPTWEGVNVDQSIKAKLIEDIISISKMAGQFKVDEGFKHAFLEWFPKNDEKQQNLRSSTLKYFLARTHTNILKLAQVFSASESNELIITLDHWNKARTLLETVNKDLPRLIAVGERQMHGTIGIKHEIISVLRTRSNLSYRDLKGLVSFNSEQRYFSEALKDLSDSGFVSIELGQPPRYSLIKDPQDQL